MKSHFDDIHDSDDEDDVLPSYKYEKFWLRDTYRYYLDYKTRFEYALKNFLKSSTNPDDSTFQLFLERRSKEKELLYLKVFVRGFVILVIGSILSAISASNPGTS